MKRVIQFSIYPDGSGYVGRCMDLPIVTEGDTVEELLRNMREALDVHLEGENLAELGIAPDPAVIASLEIPAFSYA